MELFDVLDCTGARTGKTIPRDEAHRLGVWHGSFHAVIIYEREGRRFVLFQKRSASKKIAPGKFDVSVGGHYAAGEDAASAGPREIREELNLNVTFPELVPLGRRVFVYCFTPGVLEYEFQDVYLLPKQVKPEETRIQKEEVEALLEMEITEGIRLFSGQSARVEFTLYRPNTPPAACRVSKDDFVSCLDNYYLKLLLLADRYLRGERPLLVI